MLDAPPTGRITQFLNVNNELAGLAKVGPIKSQADTVMTLFRSPRTAVHLVTVLEEMPVQETADGIAELRKARLPVGGVVVNLVRPQDLDDEDLADAARRRRSTRDAIAADLKQAGVDDGERAASTALLGEARDHAERRALEDAQRALVAELGVPTYELPRLAGGVDLGGLYELAAALERAGIDVMTRLHAAARRARSAARRARRRPDAGRRRPARRPRHRHHRLLRLRRRRQDHDVRRARAARRRARPQGRGAHHRPGPPAGPVDGHRGARQHAPAGRAASTPADGGSLDAMMLDMKRTFDEVVESQATPEKAKQILENPFYIALSSSFAGTQEYMAMEKLGQIHRDAQRGRELRPDRRGHPAVAVGAGLPRRPRAALELPRRPVHPAAAGARARVRPG